MSKNKLTGRWLVIVIVTVMLLVFSGCDTSADNNVTAAPTAAATKASGGETAATTAEPEANPFEEHFTISWAIRPAAEENNQFQQALEEQFNITIEYYDIEPYQEDAVRLMLTAGEQPDVFYTPHISPLELWENGSIRSLPKDWVREYCPNYTALLDSDPIGWNINNVPDNSDEFLCFMTYYAYSNKPLYLNAFRLDWLEALNIDPPGEVIMLDGGRVGYSTSAYTIAEVKDILTAFVKQDPDGDGENNTIGMTGYKNGYNNFGFMSVMGAYGISHMYTVEAADGSVIHPAISEEWKAFLKEMADWYADGLIDQEFVVQDKRAGFEKVGKGQVGFHDLCIFYLDYETRLEEPPGNSMAANPDAKWLMLAPMIGPDGKQGYPANSTNPYGQIAYISSKVEDDKLIRLMQIKDYIDNDQEGYVFYFYGIEGEHYKWSGEPYESVIEREEWVMLNDEYVNIGLHNFNFCPVTDNASFKWTFNKRENEIASWVIFGDGAKYSIFPYKVDIFNETEYATLKSDYDGNLTTIRDEFFVKAITGKIDIDAEWDGYVQQFNNAGWAEMAAELDKLPAYSELLD